jgi:hypothetical protein
MEHCVELPDLGSTDRERKKRAVAAIRDEQSERQRRQVLKVIRLAAGGVGCNLESKAEA